jgi:hypothetical protein
MTQIFSSPLLLYSKQKKKSLFMGVRENPQKGATNDNNKIP